MAARRLGDLGDAGPIPACGDDAGALDQAGRRMPGAGQPAQGAFLGRVGGGSGGQRRPGHVVPSSARRRHDEHEADRQNYTASKERSTTGSLLVTAVGRGAVADLRRQRQAAVAAAGAAVLVTTTASSASTLQGISHARNATGHKLLTAGSAPMPVASAPRAATVAACGSGGAGWPGCSASKACQQNEKAQHTSVQCRRIARSLLTRKSHGGVRAAATR